MWNEIPTPAVIVDAARLQRNLEAAQSRAKNAGVQLRPHVKTHRSVEIARRQLAAGAHGITCAKPAEAEVFVDQGFDDVRVAYPTISQHHLARLTELSRRARVSFCVDSVAGAQRVSSAFGSAGLRARVLVKIDCGYGRAGWRWDDESLAEAGREISRLPGLEVVGVLTHAGQSYELGDPAEPAAARLKTHAANERDRTEFAGRVLTEVLAVDGLLTAPLEVSVGSTPTFWSFEPSGDSGSGPKVSEVRPGNYVFHDLTQVALGVCDMDSCSLSVLATVVSSRQRHGRRHALIDAGKKVLTSDQRAGQSDFGLILDEQASRASGRLEVQSDWRVHALSEEHGWLDLPADSALEVGDRVRLVPNHSCVVASTQSRLIEVRGDEVVGEIEVSARGCST